ncbi:uncharacterized protein BJ212DRAFT_1444372 [Suillus subaureus]|uniref:Uncharacterized protein n=1 Tax=Suillus subaureus TaxID=48587 RepID=A0A9P7EKP9_9AGAM|nr:uncharacterized protein BJ212DRAFT_1444372 [Suillus subaureus]KAG1824583.1 hypothetical protein BJ212DRAFT_1444372 [Suillus subaureus]
MLHTCHNLEVVGEDKLDDHFKAYHNISHINLMTCWEHHNIEWTIVSMITGTANTTPDFVHAIHSLTKFIYQAQSPMHTDSSIDAMVCSLDKFHRLKLNASAQRGKSEIINNFLIPKMELFHSFARCIRELGGLIQFSADVSEWLLITHCKFLFKRTG